MFVIASPDDISAARRDSDVSSSSQDVRFSDSSLGQEPEVDTF